MKDCNAMSDVVFFHVAAHLHGSVRIELGSKEVTGASRVRDCSDEGPGVS